MLNKRLIILLLFIFFGGMFSFGINDVDASKPINAFKISMKAKPSCGFCSKMKYKWYNRVFINYCPHCKHFSALLRNPKGVYEKEYTCKYCGADYCGVCGHDKHGNRRIGSKYKLSMA